MASLSETLQGFMQRAGVGTQTLSKLTGIPRTAIDNWRDGSARRPRHWRPLLQIAHVLTLGAAETDALLAAAGYPSLAALAHDLPVDHPDRRHLHPWTAALPAARAAAPAALRHQLRAPAADFVGRAGAIEQLLSVLGRAPGGTVAAISGVRGMGGIGKTELAVLVAHHLSGTYPDAQLVINLRGSSATPLPVAQALQQVIHTFTPGTQLPDDAAALQQTYCAVLHGQRALILADDARDAAQVQLLLPPPGCALLLTSRQRFALPGMTVLDLEQLEADAAVALVRGICRRLTARDAQALARACDYLPLALRISAGILQSDPALPVAGYLARLADTRARLAQLQDPDDPARDVAASLALSYAQLDATAQRVFRQLGVLGADFATSLALAVVEVADGVDGEAALRQLLRRNLVMYNVASGRWRLHDLLRDLAREYLAAAGEYEAAMWRYARAAVRIAQTTQEQFIAGGDGSLAALAQFDAERVHIDAARQWAALHAGTAPGDALLVAATRATRSIGPLRYDWHTYLPQLEEAHAAARRLGDQQAEGDVLSGLGNAYYARGEPRHALPYFAQQLAIARQLGDRRGEGEALNNLGIAEIVVGNTRSARMYYEQRLAITQEIGDRSGECLTLTNLGVTYGMLGDAGRATAYFVQGLAVARQIGEQRIEGMALSNLGYLAIESGDAQSAKTYTEQALDLYRELGSPEGIGRSLGNLGLAHLDLGDVQQAVVYLEQALTLSREVGVKREEVYALEYLGRAYAAQGDMTRATTTFTQALDIFADTSDPQGEAECRWHFGLALAGQREWERALPLMRAALAYEQEIGHAKAAEHAAVLAQLEAQAETLEEFPTITFADAP